MLFSLDGIKYRPEDFLLKKNERVPKSELKGDEKVLKSPVIEKAFQRILEDYVPHHNKVIFSLCTSTRPYLKSVKWKTYHKMFGKECDLVICSNGGIIPMDYMNCYPFLDYNAPHEGNTWDELYMQVFERRLLAFLNKNKDYYKKICFAFIPDTRNYKSIEKLNIPNSKLVPDRETYRNVLDGKDLYIGFPVQRYPTLSYSILKQMEDYLEVYSDYLQNLVEEYSNKKNKDMNIREIIENIYERIDDVKGYTLDELVQIGFSICDVYKPSYISSGIKASTNNINITTSGYGQYNKNLFFVENGLFYIYTNESEYNKNKQHRSVRTTSLF